MIARTDEPRRHTVDEALSGGVSFAFSFTLGVIGVGIPLLAAAAGYSAIEIGVLVGVAGLAQLVARLWLGRLLRVVPDKLLVVIAGLAMTVACLLLTYSTELLVFTVAQIMQGAGRAYFWTGLQTHAVRVAPRAVGAIARLNFSAGVGALLGPLVAGVLLTFGDDSAMFAGAAAALASAVLAALLVSLPPFAPPPRPGAARMWRRREIRTGIWMGVVAGGWRSILNSYIPVVLVFGGMSPVVVGLLITIANIAAMVGSSAIGFCKRIRFRITLAGGGVAAGAGVAVTGLLSFDPWLAGSGLVVSGVAAGILQTVGTAAVADSVHPEERGDAIAASGAYRAAALLLTPLVAAAAIVVAPVPVAIALVGVLFVVPSFLGQPDSDSEARHPVDQQGEPA